MDTIKTDLQQKLSLAPPINALVKFDMGDDGAVYMDGREQTPVLKEEPFDQDPDLTLKASKEVFQGIMNGTQDPTMAYMMGKLKVNGPMGLAMKLNSILED